MPFSLADTEFCAVSIESDIAVIELNRPARRNALHPAAHHELDHVFDTLAETKGLRVVILTGAGEAFCAGYDLRDNLETGVMEIAPNGFGGLTSRTDYPMPLIAAVNGVALGGGFEMALACDLIIASENAKFGLPEAKVGWSPLAGGLQRLPRAIGIKRAMDLILTGRMTDAAEGKDLGFVNAVAPANDLMACAKDWAAMIMEGAPLAIRCNREVAYKSMDQPDFPAALNIENYDTVAPMLNSRDAIEGKKAFVEKRKPSWNGT